MSKISTGRSIYSWRCLRQCHQIFTWQLKRTWRATSYWIPRFLFGYSHRSTWFWWHCGKIRNTYLTFIQILKKSVCLWTKNLVHKLIRTFIFFFFSPLTQKVSAFCLICFRTSSQHSDLLAQKHSDFCSIYSSAVQLLVCVLLFHRDRIFCN